MEENPSLQIQLPPGKSSLPKDLFATEMTLPESHDGEKRSIVQGNGILEQIVPLDQGAPEPTTDLEHPEVLTDELIAREQGLVDFSETLPLPDLQQQADFLTSGDNVSHMAEIALATIDINADTMRLSNERAVNALLEHEIALQAILGQQHSAAVNGVEAMPSLPFTIDIGDQSIAVSPAFEPTLPMSASGDMFMTLEPSAIDEPSSAIQDFEGPQIRAFAKLEFDDGPFYMNTYSVELGRDVQAAKFIRKESKGKERRRGGTPGPMSSSAGDLPQTPIRHGRQDSGTHVPGSVVSESGGIMGLDTSDQDATPSTRKKRSRRASRKSKSTTSDSVQLSRKNSNAVSNLQTDYQSLAMASLANGQNGALPVDPLSLLPSPDECPLIPIHPPAHMTDDGGHRGISRKHVKIAFNFERHLFELHIYGRNGTFVDDRWHAPGETIALKNGSFIQIGGIGMKFSLPDVPPGETGAEGVELAGNHQSAVSFGTHERHAAVIEDDSDELSEVGLTSSGDNDEVDDEEEEEEEEEEEVEEGDDEGEEEEEEVEEREENGLRRMIDYEHESAGGLPAEGDEAEEAGTSLSPTFVAIRRGPGRPPKNGIMSKRQQQQLAREAKLALKLNVTASVADSSQARYLGTSSLEEMQRQEESLDQQQTLPKPEKRKYTKRKVMDDVASPEKARTDDMMDRFEPMPMEVRPTKEKKERKPTRAPRSPSPVFDEASLTPEQLAKPQSSYVILIHEALTHSRTGAMSLPQIYRAIERRYPFYKLRVTTTGWQSSVRHNLSQHHAFQKVERDGKGWMWGIVPGVSIEKEKKRRASPPMQMPPAYAQHPGYFGPPPLSMQYPHLMAASTAGLGARAMGPPPSHPLAGHPPPGSTYVQSLLPHHPLQAYAANLKRSPSGYQSPYADSAPVPVALSSTTISPLNQPLPPYPPPPRPSNHYPVPPHPLPHYSYQQPDPRGQPLGQKGPPSRVPLPSANRVALSAQRPGPSLPANKYKPPLHQSPSPQTSTQPHPHAHTQPRAAPMTTPTSARHSASPSLSSEIINAVQNFKSALIKSMPKGTSPSSEAIVQSAVNRALGLSDRTSLPGGEEHPKEEMIMRALNQLIGGLTAKSGPAKQPPKAAAPPTPPPVASVPAPSQQRPSSSQPTNGTKAKTNISNNANATNQLLQYLQKASKSRAAPELSVPPAKVAAVTIGSNVHAQSPAKLTTSTDILPAAPRTGSTPTTSTDIPPAAPDTGSTLPIKAAAAAVATATATTQPQICTTPSAPTPSPLSTSPPSATIHTTSSPTLPSPIKTTRTTNPPSHAVETPLTPTNILSPSPGLSSAGATPTPPNDLADLAASALQSSTLSVKRPAPDTFAQPAPKRERLQPPPPLNGNGSLDTGDNDIKNDIEDEDEDEDENDEVEENEQTRPDTIMAGAVEV